MPMDENTKNELVKKIQEQREALMKGKSLSNQPKKQIQSNSESEQQKPTNVVDTMKLSDLIADDQMPDDQGSEEKAKRSLWSLLKSENSGISWTKATLIVSALIGALLFGIFLGYLATVLEAMKKI